MRSFTARVFLASIAFALIYAITVPLMSSYGMQVSHELHELGFWDSCRYIGLSSLASLLVTGFLVWIVPTLTPMRGFFLHLLAVMIGSALSAQVFDYFQLLTATRFWEVMGLIGVFLGVQLAYLLRWVGVSKAATHDFKKSWWRALIAGVTPALGVALFNTHYIFRLTDFEVDDMLLTLVSITGWMVLAYLIHYRTEYRRAMIFSYGLERLLAQDFNARVPSFAGGVWAPLGGLLNGALTALQERARLLRGMTRFIAREMGEQIRGFEKIAGKANVKRPLVVVNIHSFKDMAQKLGDDALTALLTTYINEVLEIFVRHNLVMHRFNGDKLIAYGEGSTEDAFLGCANLLQDLPRLNKSLISHKLPELHLGLALMEAQVSASTGPIDSELHQSIASEIQEDLLALEGLSKKLGVSLVTPEECWKTLSPESKAWLVSKGTQSWGPNRSATVYSL